MPDDIAAAVCEECVAAAAKDIRRRCPNQIKGVDEIVSESMNLSYNNNSNLNLLADIVASQNKEQERVKKLTQAGGTLC